jgi:hypothetical protein
MCPNQDYVASKHFLVSSTLRALGLVSKMLILELEYSHSTFESVWRSADYQLFCIEWQVPIHKAIFAAKAQHLIPEGIFPTNVFCSKFYLL